MKRDWIITYSNSENGYVEFKKFYGTESEMKKELFKLAKKSNIIQDAIENNDDEEYTSEDIIKDLVSDCYFDSDNNTYSIMVHDDNNEIDEVYTAIELEKIKRYGEVMN